jgi:hypothetical protein
VPDTIVLAQADAPDAPAEAAIQAQIERIQVQVDELVNEVQVLDPQRPVVLDSPNGARDALVSAFLITAIVAVLCVRFYLSYRAKQEIQATVRAALERGVPITGELLDRIVDTPTPKRSDLRRGVIWMALGLGVAAIGLIDVQDLWKPMLGIGLVPLLLGGAYLVLWRLGDRKA